MLPVLWNDDWQSAFLSYAGNTGSTYSFALLKAKVLMHELLYANSN